MKTQLSAFAISAMIITTGFSPATSENSVDTKQKVKAEYVARRDYVVEALNKIEGVFCPKPSGAFYCIVQLPIDDSDKFCQWLLEKFEYNQQTVMLAPATGFYSKPELGKKQVRLAYVLNLDDLKNAMACLEKALTEYPGRVVQEMKSVAQV